MAKKVNKSKEVIFMKLCFLNEKKRGELLKDTISYRDRIKRVKVSVNTYLTYPLSKVCPPRSSESLRAAAIAVYFF